MGPTAEDEENAEQRARLCLQMDLDQAKAAGFSVATAESFELAASDDDEVVEVVPDVDDWDLFTDGEIVNSHNEQVKVDVIQEERAKEVDEDLNKILELSSIDPKPSETSAASSAESTGGQMTDSQI